MFLDDTPAYPAAFFGAVRAGLVPLLINLQTPPDLLQFYLADSGATVAITEAAFAETFDAAACKNTRLKTLIAVNGTAHADVAADLIAAEPWLPLHPIDCARPIRIATTWRFGCIPPARPDAPRELYICKTTCSTPR